jgi:hypothetical protein
MRPGLWSWQVIAESAVRAMSSPTPVASSGYLKMMLTALKLDPGLMLNHAAAPSSPGSRKTAPVAGTIAGTVKSSGTSALFSALSGVDRLLKKPGLAGGMPVDVGMNRPNE